MTTYTIESVNGKTCRHRANTVDQAAVTHGRVHIDAHAVVIPVAGQRGWYQACRAMGSLPLRQPFRVCGS